MNIIKILYKVVENPHSFQNYNDLKEYFAKNNMLQFAEAFEYLLETKHGTDNSNTSEENK